MMIKMLYLPIITEEKWQEMEQKLSPLRKEKASRIRHEMTKQQSIAAGYLMEMHLRDMEKKHGVKLSIVQNEKGKPIFSPEIGEYFNVSHSGDYVMLATHTAPIGVDIEMRREAGMNIAHRFFTEEEAAFLETLPIGVKQDIGFIQLWTKKEALIKADGRGLTLSLNSFSVLCKHEGRYTQSTVLIDGKEYFTCSYMVSKGLEVSNPEVADAVYSVAYCL